MKPTTLNDALDRIAEIESQLEHRSRCLLELLAFVQSRAVDGNMTNDERHVLLAAHKAVFDRLRDREPWGDDETLAEVVDNATSARIG